MVSRFLFLLVLAGPALLSQVGATLSGRVQDSSGAVVPQAAVVLVNENTNRRATTDSGAAGLYLFPSVEPGVYTLTVEKQGFRAVQVRKLEVNVGGEIVRDIRLEPGDLAFAVTVEAGRTEIERDLVAAGVVVDRKFVDNLPLNGRSFQSLIELAPGAVMVKASGVSPGQFSVNGQRSNANYFVVDGVAGNAGASTIATFSQQAAGTLPALTVLGGTNSLVLLDALEEFRIQTSNFAPEYGRAPGAQVVMVTRSGSNAYHGSLFHELRNEKLDANDWFANASGRGRSPFRLNQFGGTFNGPVTLPGLYRGKDRTFFFAAYEGLRLREPQFQRVQVPTASARERARGPVRELLNAFPLPNAASPFTNPDQGLFESAYSDPAESNIFSLRLDQNLGRAGTLFFRLNLAPTERQTRAFANQLTSTFLRTDTYTAGWTSSLTPRLVHELRANWSRSRGGFVWDHGAINGAVRPADSLIFPSYTDRDRASAGFFLGAFLTGINPPNLTQGRSIGNQQRQFQVFDSWTLVRGGHEIKFGADLRFLFPIADFREYGISYNFGTITQAIDTGLATVQVQALAPRGGFTLPGFGFFAQDTWRATSRFTLSYGLRWEFVPPPSTSDDRPLYRLDQVDRLLASTVAPAGASLWDTRWNNIEPRVGVSYLVSKSRDLVFKAGFGLFHDLGTGQASRGFNSWPYNSVRSTVNTPFPAAAGVLQPLPFNSAPPYSAEFYITDPALSQPYTLQWSAGFEKAWKGAGVVDVRYVGNGGRRLLLTETLRNRAANASLGLAANTVLNPALFTTGATVYLTSNRASSDYHGLQTQFRRRVVSGLQAQVSYTFGKALDNLSDETATMAPVSRLDPNSDRAPASFDVRHNLVGAVNYDLPRVKGPAGVILSRWSLDTFLRARSATPVNVFTGSDLLNTGITTVVRPDPVPGVPVYIESSAFPGGRRVNPAAFQAAPAGRQGYLGRNTVRGLAAYQWDFALRRQIAFGERTRLELRGEFYNILNRANFGDPSGQLVSGTTVNPVFGIAQTLLNRSLSGGGGLSPLFQIGGPRSVQIALRLRF